MLFGVMALVGFCVSAAVVRLPFYGFRPGSVRDTPPLVHIEGAETYEPEGSINYLTVSLRQLTLVGLGMAWWDDDIDVYDRDQVVSTDNPDEQRQVNLAMMADSKEIATYVALTTLGYDVPASATGELVVEVSSDMPAEGKLEVGDVIVQVDGEPIDDPEDLSRLMDAKEPGDDVALLVQNSISGEERTVTMTLAEDPETPGRAIMGVRVGATGVEFDFPVEVSVETGEVGGPSAGLAFTLSILDELTPGELTGGHDVAITGEILVDGTVKPVGGVRQKAAAARRDGVELFLVPDGEGADARARAGDDMEVVEVSSLDEALAALAEIGGNGLDLPQVGAEQAAA
jgi:Lon-like protease